MAASVISLHLTTSSLDPTSAAQRHTPAVGISSYDAIERLEHALMAAKSGSMNGKLVVRVDSSAAVAATGDITCVAASLAAGDQLFIKPPGAAAYAFTLVATDAEVTASPTTGLYSKQTNTNNAIATSLTSAINNHAGLSRYVTATDATGHVTLTAANGCPGASGNNIVVTKKVATAAGHVITAMSGGVNAGALAVATVVLDQSKLTADDTLRIGSTTYTWKASAATESQVTIGASSTAAGDNLAAKINAHSTHQGLLVASNASGTVTITCYAPPRVAEQIYMVKTENVSGAMTLTQMAGPATDSVGGTSPATYSVGAT